MKITKKCCQQVCFLGCNATEVLADSTPPDLLVGFQGAASWREKGKDGNEGDK